MPSNEIRKILVTGSRGQIGTELTNELRERYGTVNVVACDLRPSAEEPGDGVFEQTDVRDRKRLLEIVSGHGIDTIVHLAAILSANGETDPVLAWEVNVGGLLNALEIARELELTRVLCPSSIAVFGDGCPTENTPQETVLRPTTMYGVTKVTGELLCDYYVRRFGVDARGLRYPGIVSAEVLPGGGTTDYAVEIFYKAIEDGRYACFLREDTRLPMMYMSDCIKATIGLLEADFAGLEHHGDFNVSSMSFTPGELAEAIRRHITDFAISYEPDYRQKIADSWPSSIDDTAARREWGWAADYDIDAMTEDMLTKLRKRMAAGTLYR